MSNREVVIVDGTRTAFGRMGGTLRDYSCSELGSIALKHLVEKTEILTKASVNSVFAGSAAHCSKALNPARWISLVAGLPIETSASYIEMQCGSAIDAINQAAAKIKSNQADIIIAGGMESHSQMAAKFSMATAPYRLKPPAPLELTLSPNSDENINMGLTAENLQQKFGITRHESDTFAYESQLKAKKAAEAGYFQDEIAPVVIPATRKTPEIVFDQDEHLRPQTTMEGLAKLPPAFKENGTVTAGNASGQNDGAAFVLMMESETAIRLGHTPMARWISGADCGCDPKLMGLGPAYAIPMALKRAELKLTDLDVIECNEAFAVQNLAVIKELEDLTDERINRERWNPMGGAIAFGHPNGASGARICIFAMKFLARTKGRFGLFSSCCGGGLGVACVVENLRV